MATEDEGGAVPKQSTLRSRRRSLPTPPTSPTAPSTSSCSPMPSPQPASRLRRRSSESDIGRAKSPTSPATPGSGTASQNGSPTRKRTLPNPPQQTTPSLKAQSRRGMLGKMGSAKARESPPAESLAKVERRSTEPALKVDLNKCSLLEEEEEAPSARKGGNDGAHSNGSCVGTGTHLDKKVSHGASAPTSSPSRKETPLGATLSLTRRSSAPANIVPALWVSEPDSNSPTLVQEAQVRPAAKTPPANGPTGLASSQHRNQNQRQQHQQEHRSPHLPHQPRSCSTQTQPSTKSPPRTCQGSPPYHTPSSPTRRPHPLQQKMDEERQQEQWKTQLQRVKEKQQRLNQEFANATDQQPQQPQQPQQQPKPQPQQQQHPKQSAQKVAPGHEAGKQLPQQQVPPQDSKHAVPTAEDQSESEWEELPMSDDAEQDRDDDDVQTATHQLQPPPQKTALTRARGILIHTQSQDGDDELDTSLSDVHPRPGAARGRPHAAKVTKKVRIPGRRNSLGRADKLPKRVILRWREIARKARKWNPREVSKTRAHWDPSIPSREQQTETLQTFLSTCKVRIAPCSIHTLVDNGVTPPLLLRDIELDDLQDLGLPDAEVSALWSALCHRREGEL